MIAKIAVSAANFAIDKPYSYFVPPEMTLLPGMRVAVPFGRGNRMTEGVILLLEQGDGAGLKAVDRALDPEPVLPEHMLRLAAFLRERYFCTFYDAVRAMLPGGVWFQVRQTLCLTDNREWKEKTLRQKDAQTLLELLDRLGGQAEAEKLLPTVETEERLDRAVSYLLGKKWVVCQNGYRRRASDKTEKIATLAVPAAEALAYAATRPKSAAMQRSVLELLCGVGSASVKEICYYTGAKPQTMDTLARRGFLELTEKPVLRCREIRPDPNAGELTLNGSQQAAYQALSEQMAQEVPGVALLYGVTGSGKTAVYLKLIRACLDSGKSALLLVPEIALTPQLLGLVAAHFGSQVAVLHSSLPSGERYDQWKRVRSGEANVVVGTRSAVFAPCRSLGLIVLDEEQEHSYKSENTPRYSAKEVAIWRGAKEKALVLLGSATPSVETMYRAKQGDYRLYRLDGRFNGRPLPSVDIVDMRQELESGNDSCLSLPLRQELEAAAGAGKQAVLFLNRRGNSRALVCVDCREAPECPRCSARLTYHSANQRMMCHYCGYSVPVPDRCPRCGGHLKQMGLGTQKAQKELAGFFPEMASERMDADTVSAVNTHEVILERFQRENIPVLLGTQMVAKGLNLPKVVLVGVLDADQGLYMDSFRAAENTFQMLTQVVGRAGRGDTPGKALIQTYTPEHPVIRLAARQDYDGFYDLEIRLRQMEGCPPFRDLAAVVFTGMEEDAVLRGAVKFRDSLRLRPEESVLGPAPCPVPKINYRFRYRLTLRCRMDRPFRLALAELLRQFMKDKGFRGVSAYVDLNGME